MKIKLEDVQRAGEPRAKGVMAVLRDGKAHVIKRSVYLRAFLDAALKDAAKLGETTATFCGRVDGVVSEEEDIAALGELVQELRAEGFKVDDSKLIKPDLIISVSWE